MDSLFDPRPQSDQKENGGRIFFTEDDINMSTTPTLVTTSNITPPSSNPIVAALTKATENLDCTQPIVASTIQSSKFLREIVSREELVELKKLYMKKIRNQSACIQKIGNSNVRFMIDIENGKLISVLIIHLYLYFYMLRR